MTCLKVLSSKVEVTAWTKTLCFDESLEVERKWSIKCDLSMMVGEQLEDAWDAEEMPVRVPQ